MVTRGEPLKKETTISSKNVRIQKLRPQWEANGATVVSWHDLSNANEMLGIKAAVGRQGWWLAVATIPGF